MIRRISSLVLLVGALAVCSPMAAKAALLAEVTEGPSSNEVVWTFSGEVVAEGFGFFSSSGVILEQEPVGMWGGFDNFTSVAAPPRVDSATPLLTLVSGSATLTHESAATGTITTANIVQGYFDDGDSGVDGIERFGIGIDTDISFTDPDIVTLAGSLVFSGAGISDFSAGGIPYFGSSSAFGNEGNNLPLNLSIGATVIPEPSSACLLGLIAVGVVSRRRVRKRVTA
ncbi:hypothetical protein LF1_25390 [Rubripirellula obstinata]|uniref:PEP-CTERM protein-sorting domain-containing protein n=1 Tax=Rubripirellula obstinata TaxID=406547 RepID=A0A5B1CID3_9BACT|nr:PEP-CTERM sorting domain-containing protein [Rubripirellula obstinata]KAA1260001.1 hypothetical protein LF1_25390 [Rubripirellula obstinata]